MDTWNAEWDDKKYFGNEAPKESCDKKDRKDRIKPRLEASVTFSDGSVHEGEWVNGRKEGNGKMISSNGDVYEGEWLKDKKNN